MHRIANKLRNNLQATIISQHKRTLSHNVSPLSTPIKTTTTSWSALPREQFPPKPLSWDALPRNNPHQVAFTPPPVPVGILPSPQVTTKPSKSLLRRLLPFVAIGTAIYGYNTFEPIVNSHGFKRSMYFWRNAGPIYLHYQLIIARLDFQQLITDILFDYDQGGNGFGHLGFSHNNLLEAQRRERAAQEELNQELEVLKNGPDNNQLTYHIHQQQQIAIDEGLNANKVDRLFENIKKLAEKLRHVADQTIYQQDQSNAAPNITIPQNRDDLKANLHQMKIFIQRSTRTVFEVCDEIISDLLTTDQHQKVTKLKQIVQLNLSTLLRGFISLVDPYMRPYTLPLEEKDKKIHRDVTFDPLNKRYADDLFDIISTLKGYYIKIGQLGALRGDFLPKEWIQSLRRFQSECPSVPFIELIPLIEKELGKPIGDVFQSIDHSPLGAASVGQAHRAILKNGQPVVMKIQYPGVEETFKVDMNVIRTFCELAQPEMLNTLEEVEKQFMTEFDFSREAVHLFYANDDLKNSPYGDIAQIPAPVTELCSKHILVMDILPGPKLITKLEDNFLGLAESSGLSLEQFMQKYADAEPLPTEQIEKYRWYGKLNDIGINTARALYNFTLGWFTENYEYQQTVVPLDIRKIMETMFDVHGHQLFLGSLVNSDPHPGNILYCEKGKFSDNNLGGTIGLIDYGQVKATNLYYRALLAKIMIALEQNDQDKVAMLWFFADQRTEHNYRNYAFDYTVLGLDYDDDESRSGIVDGKKVSMNVQAFFEHLGKMDKIIYQQAMFEMPGRAAFLLRGLTQALKYPIKTHQRWARIGGEFLASHPVLSETIDQALEEFEHYYNYEETKAKAIAIAERGNDDEYFVNLDGAKFIHKWCEAICTEYDDAFYDQLYVPFPNSVTNGKALQKKLDSCRQNRPQVLDHVKTLSQAVFINPNNPILQNYFSKKPLFVQTIEAKNSPHNITVVSTPNNVSV